MTVLYLGPERPAMIEYVKSLGDRVVRTEERLQEDDPILDEVDFVVSYGYRFILKDWFLDRFPQRVINLHISLLPYNRGADPNLWSFLEDTPKGVTIHSIDRGIDTGLVIAQGQVQMQPDDTLKSSYERLIDEIELLFKKHWPAIREEKAERHEQEPGGTYHRMKDKEPYLDLLTMGWDTPVRELIGKALVQSEG